MSRHQHFFHALYCHFGPYGSQDVHYHPCAEKIGDDTCDFALLGWGRECSRGQEHRRANLSVEADVAAAVAGLRPEAERPSEVGLCMGYLPGRKRPAVWVERAGVIEPLAYFRSEDAYARFKALLGGKGLVQIP